MLTTSPGIASRGDGAITGYGQMDSSLGGQWNEMTVHTILVLNRDQPTFVTNKTRVISAEI